MDKQQTATLGKTQAREITGPLTEDVAADVIEGLLSPLEDTADPQVTPEPSEPTADDSAEPEIEAEGEPATEPDAEPSDEPVDEPVVPETYQVKVNGQDIEVSLDELKRGFSRTRDYTEKTMALAEQRKSLEAELGQAREQRSRYQATLDKLEAAMTANMPSEPDWDKVRKETPEEFPTLMADWSLHKERLAKVQAEKERVSKQEQADQMKQVQAAVQAEHAKLLEALPNWRETEKRNVEQAALASYAKRVGFSDQELQGIYDHRAVLVLRKAMLYDQLQAKKPEARKVIEKIRTATPGPGTKKSPVPEAKRAYEKLTKTGSVDDAAAVFLHAIRDN